jgi:hypothetical protein
MAQRRIKVTACLLFSMRIKAHVISLATCRELLSQILPKFQQTQEKKVDLDGDDFQKPKSKKKKVQYRFIIRIILKLASDNIQAEKEGDGAPPKKKVKTEHVPIVDLTAERVKQESQSEERKKKLKDDPVLREIYNEIVGNGVLSEEEFWQSRAVSF